MSNCELLRQALLPLARIDLTADQFDLRPDDQPIYQRGSSPPITVGDVRRAKAAITVQCGLAALPEGWKIEVDVERLRVTKPGGRVSEWYERPKTNGSGMYDLCMALVEARHE